MPTPLTRRSFLQSSSALAAVASTGLALPSRATAQALQVPAIDKLAIRVLLDSSHDIFLAPQKIAGVEMERARPAKDFRRILHNQWGLSLYLESQRGSEARAVMLDFGYSPEALLNNIDITGVDPAKIEALIVSHGHYDHFGGLIGFLQKYRNVLPADLTLTAGGEHNFCRRYNRTPVQGQFSDFGVLDRREIAAHNVKLAFADTPVVIGHAFSTGPIKRTSFEKVLPNTMVEYAMKDGVGCDVSKFGGADLAGKTVPDEHEHEHGTCFNIKDKGLVVISSCGHTGIINTIRQAQEASGVKKLHAVLGGFHFGPGPQPYVNEAVAELKKLEPDVVIPMHCSGINFIQAMREQMPDKLLLSTTGSRIVFGA
jgi:7,8-dihydropterin-6-yl-methyl-4-(beta-D-ribofuranosyl)aminobenzene 5'-phosphate synthase